jgi:metal-sulfur cluster biosynthetic enzyme
MDDATAIDPTSTPLSQAELDAITDQLIDKLKTVYDPEIPVDIYELGLIYKVDVSDDKDVAIDMTLTAPGCRWPARCRAGWKDAVREIPDVRSVKVTWSSIPRGTPRE